LLEEAEFAARRDAEQMGRTLADFREALSKLESVNEENWTKDTFNVELTRALTTIENARMEWNSARLKFDVLSGAQKAPNAVAPQSAAASPVPIGDASFLQLCRLGLAMTWPLTLATIGVIVTLLILLYR
jgi:hypothetical protein